MRTWKRIVLLLLAFAYLPAASLCLVECAGLVDNQNCCSPTAQGDSEGDGSGQTACCLLASPVYKLADDRDVPTSVLMSPFLAVTEFEATENPPPAEIYPVSASPPELPITWQFSFRAALPPRAPSLIA